MVRDMVYTFANFFKFGRTSFERDMMTYAKTEYKSDWRYAYEYMVTHDGKAPSNARGVTL